MLNEEELHKIAEYTRKGSGNPFAHADKASLVMRRELLKRFGIYGEKTNEVMDAEERLVHLRSSEQPHLKKVEQKIGHGIFMPTRVLPPVAERWPQLGRIIEKMRGTPQYPEALSKLLRTLLPEHRQKTVDAFLESLKQLKFTDDPRLVKKAERIEARVINSLQKIYEANKEESRWEKLNRIPGRLSNLLDYYTPHLTQLNEDYLRFALRAKLKHGTAKTVYAHYTRQRRKLDEQLVNYIYLRWNEGWRE
jgi:hypothetical protein